jgi:hypothetical protein
MLHEGQVLIAVDNLLIHFFKKSEGYGISIVGKFNVLQIIVRFVREKSSPGLNIIFFL